MSETKRIAKGNDSSAATQIRQSTFGANATIDQFRYSSRPRRERHFATLKLGKCVVHHEALLNLVLLHRAQVQAAAVFSLVPKVSVAQACVSPRVKQRPTVRRASECPFAPDVANLV